MIGGVCCNGEKHSERLIGVELKVCHIQAMRARQTHLDKLVHEGRDCRLVVIESVIQFDALFTGDTSQERDDWFVGVR